MDNWTGNSELRELDLALESFGSPPASDLPAIKSETVADLKQPLEGELLPPPHADNNIATADEDALFDPIAERIHARQRRGVGMIVENGRDLLTVKEKMGHGRFGGWLRRKFGWSERTAQNYMNAAKAFDEFAKEGCAPEAIALMPPSMLYRFDKQPDVAKKICIESVRSGSVAKALKAAKLAKAGKKASAQSPANNKSTEAEALAKIITADLSHSIREKIAKHAGFRAADFGKLLEKEIADSFGVSSDEAAP